MAQDPLHLLCVEPRFPGRLGPVADWLVRRRGYRCQFYCNAADPPQLWPASVGRGLDVVTFGVGGVAREAAAHWSRLLERGICYAYGCWEVLDARRPRRVDVVLGRSAGLGSTLFIRAALPRVPVVQMFDYFPHAHAHDLAAEMPADTPADYFHWRRAAGAMDLLELESGFSAWAPTAWQRDLYPAEYRDDFFVLHDGVDAPAAPRPAADRRTISGRTVPPGARVVTFVARSLGRLRGLDRFVELGNRLTRARSDVVCVVVGDGAVHHSVDVEYCNRNYLDDLLGGNPLHDPERWWFLGAAAPAVVAEALAASDLHVYPSRDYPVSRSLLEAMAAGCVVLAWDAAPVREFIDSGKTGLIAADLDAAEAMGRAALDDPGGYRALGDAAAAAARARFVRDVTLPRLAEFLSAACGSARPR